MSTANSTARRIQRALPFVVIGLGLVAGVMFAVFLATRSDQPIGEASPSPTADASLPASPSSSPGATASEPGEPTATEEPTPTPVPSGPAQIGWRAGGEGPGSIGSVISFDDHWIAGGMNADHRATLWFSPDGRTWADTVQVGPEPGSEQFSSVGVLAPWKGDLLAFMSSGWLSNDSRSAQLYRSADGRTWESVDVSQTPYGKTWHLPWEVVEAPDGRLALLSLTGLGGGASVYLTDDLVSWEEHPIIQTSDGSDSSITVSGLAASDSLLIAVGTERFPYVPDESAKTVPHAWMSVDAATWTPISAPSAEGTLAAIAWDPVRARFVAVGTNGDGLPRAWLTTDGARWSTITLGTEPISMQVVVAAEGLIVATGVSGSGFDLESGELTAWSSHDGVTWWYGPLLDGQARTMVAATSDSAVIVANQENASGRNWWVPLSGSLEPTSP